MPENDKKLFLLDTYALIFRSYFAFVTNPRVTSKGFDTSTIFGFTTTLLEVLKRQKPTHLAMVYDTDVPTQRHKEYEEYKANRDETPEAIRVSMPYIEKIADAFDIRFLGVDGYEADDVIGTLAKKAEMQGFEVYMMTSDKDFGQLVSDNIKIYRPGRQGSPAEIWGVKEVLDKFDIDTVEQVVDYLAMMGDAVDNIPGFPGVGPKTASKLLKQYGSMENMLDHAGEIKGKLGERIRKNEKQGKLFKKLARIIVDVPIDFKAELFEKKDPNKEKIRKIFSELEFRTLLKKFMEETLEKSTPQGSQVDLFGNLELSRSKKSRDQYENGNIHNTDHFYQLINHVEERKLLLKYLLKQEEVCFDIKATDVKASDSELVGIAFSYPPLRTEDLSTYLHIAYYVDIPKGEERKIVTEFKPFFEDISIVKIGHNIKYDITVLKNYDVEIKGKMFDTMLAHYLIQPDTRHNMGLLAETYLYYQLASIESLIGGKGKKQDNMQNVDSEKVKEYAGENADITLQLKDLFEPELRDADTQSVFENIEMPLVSVLADMESEGVNLDRQVLGNLSLELSKDIEKLKKEILRDADTSFNIASPKQLGEVLFEKMKLVEKPKKTKSGQYTTSEDILIELAKEHEIGQKILDYRQLSKLKSTYVDALPEMISPITDRIHTSFSQAVAATGRLSSSNPNLQNIPIRTKRGREVRKAFIPRNEKCLILAADYSQIELRLIAHFSYDENMIEAFLADRDIHAITAAKLFGVKQQEITRKQRSDAKTVNFGIIYGVSVFGLSQQTSLSRNEASEAIESYFRTYPRVRDYIKKQKEFARKYGYVETIMKRRRYLKDINSKNHTVRSHAERNAVNAPIQGSAADIIKQAMINIHHKLKEGEFQAKMVLQVHDELVFDVPSAEIENIKPMIKSSMENTVRTKVPMIANLGQGKNWLEAHWGV